MAQQFSEWSFLVWNIDHLFISLVFLLRPEQKALQGRGCYLQMLTDTLFDVIVLLSDFSFLNHCTDYHEEKKVLNGKSYKFMIKNGSYSYELHSHTELFYRIIWGSIWIFFFGGEDIFYTKDVFTYLNLEALAELYRSLTPAITLRVSSPSWNIPEHGDHLPAAWILVSDEEFHPQKQDRTSHIPRHGAECQCLHIDTE